MGLVKKEQKIYASIISDGSIRVQSDSSNPNAVIRKYETSDGKKGEKYEMVYQELYGKITAMEIKDGNYGKQLYVTLKDNPVVENEDLKDDVILCLSLSQSFADDLMKKLPNVALDETVTLTPYSFTDDKKKLRKGITVWQKGEKVPSFFYDGKKSVNGIPDLPKKEVYTKWDSEDWKVYFIKISKFLQKYLEEKVIPEIPVAEGEDELPDLNK